MTLPKKNDVRRARRSKRGSENRPASDPWQSVAEHFKLTPGELHVVQLLDEALSDKQIASRLGRSKWDVVEHQRNIRAKMNVHSRAEIGKAIREFLRNSENSSYPP